jgi:hypothetical protein
VTIVCLSLVVCLADGSELPCLVDCEGREADVRVGRNHRVVDDLFFTRLRPRNFIRRVLRLTKSLQAPRCRWEHRLPLKNISHLMRHQSVKPDV